MRFPFEASLDDIQKQSDAYVAAIFSVLESDFLILPRGEGFVDYPAFEIGYEALKHATANFTTITPAAVLAASGQVPIALIVLRTILGFTPPEWAYVTVAETGVRVEQGFVRALDRAVRLQPLQPLGNSRLRSERLEALVTTACRLLSRGAPAVEPSQIHRMDKADTHAGAASLRTVATLGVPYTMLLYERFLGRPFAGHRDSVSEKVGAGLEAAIEDVLVTNGISYRRTKRAERIPGFDQAPDFIVPSEYNPQVVIEAKITEDDGTARDKITRIQHLDAISRMGQPEGQSRFQVVACIGGRGFKVRREDMRKLLLATRGKTFTINTLDRLVEYTRLSEFKTLI